MKLYSYISCGLLAAAALGLASCDAVYEDLEPCPKGADVTLTYTRNLLNVDAYAAKVHCANLLLYNDQGYLVGNYPYNGAATLSLDLPAGRYHAIAYGGMHCDDSHFDYSKDVNGTHSYPGLYTFIKGTRAGEVSDNLHSHFHGTADFEVPEDAAGHVPSTISLTKNTNNFRVVFQYEDGSPITPNDFNYWLTADNATLSHDNKIIPSGAETTYRPYETGTFTGLHIATGGECANAYADLSTSRLEPSTAAILHVTTAAGDKVMDLDLIRYLNMIRANEMRSGSLQDYLDCQDMWTLVFMLDPQTNQLAGLQFKVNDWILNLANSDLEF